MQFLRILLWVVIALFVLIIGYNNWVDVTINLWGTLQVDIKLPVLIGLTALLGFLPPYLILRARLWTARRRLAALSQAAPVTANPPAPAATGSTEGLVP